MEEKAPDPETIHRIHVGVLDLTDAQGLPSRVVMARIQLFCNSPSSGYVVFFGHVKADKELVQRAEFHDASPWPMHGDLASLRGTA